MNVLVSILGYGDALITLSLLERADRAAASQFHVVGTALTAAAGGLLRQPRAPDEVLFADKAAFYAVKERGAVAAARDFLRFRRWARRFGGGDTLIFEKTSPLRHRALVPARCRHVEIPRASTAYLDRERVLRPWLGTQSWPSCAVPEGRARRLLINPSARDRDRVFGQDIVDAALRAAAQAGAEVCLIDVDGSRAALRAQVQTYLHAPPLREAAAALREADRYFGPDSFFMHLAYYYRVPQLALFHPHNLYFEPPGLFASGGHLYFEQARGAALDAALGRLLGSAAGLSARG